MGTIKTLPFGSTGHMSTRTIFGSFTLFKKSREKADAVLELLLKYGVNHIDTAPSYGDAELNIGPWMKQHRKDFFLATKIERRTYPDAREQFHRSLERLQVDSVDLLQLHNLTDIVGQEVVMGPGGAMEFLIEAKERGLTRFIGITGHGIQAPQMHKRSLEQFKFDSVLMPCNYPLMQNEDYAGEFNDLVFYCKQNGIAVQTIKSIARGYWGDRQRTHITWYEPLSDKEAISKFVHYVLSIPDIFLITAGDRQVLPVILEAAAKFQDSPPDEVMQKLVEKHSIEPIF
jgi:aryl-alcohol dehydrogenase-like predicted oxidoreductase